MSEAKPCLPGCRYCRYSADGYSTGTMHAPACPNAAPKASEAPGESYENTPQCEVCGGIVLGLDHAAAVRWFAPGGGHTNLCRGKPAPAPEPKRGSEEPIEPVTELEAEKSTSKILRALLAKAEAERDEARATKDMHKERQEEAWAEVAALRAENERLQGIIMGTSAEYRVTLGVNLRRYWSAENQVMLGRMLFDEDVPALRAELAAAREEIAAIKRQAEDATEYVLAVDNRELRKEIEGLRIRVGEYEDMTEINKRFSEIEAELAAAREEISKLREMRAPTTPTVEMVRLRQSNQNLMMLYANAIGECRKINKAIHRVLRGRNNAVKQLAAEKARADRAEERVKELEVEVERRKTFNKTGFRLLKEKCKQLHSVTYCQDDRCNLGPHHHAVERKEHPPDDVSYSGLIHYGSEIGCAECAILAARARKEGGNR